LNKQGIIAYSFIKKIKFIFVFIEEDIYNKFNKFQYIIKSATIFVHFLAQNIKVIATRIFNRAHAYTIINFGIYGTFFNPYY